MQTLAPFFHTQVIKAFAGTGLSLTAVKVFARQMLLALRCGRVCVCVCTCDHMPLIIYSLFGFRHDLLPHALESVVALVTSPR